VGVGVDAVPPSSWEVSPEDVSPPVPLGVPDGVAVGVSSPEPGPRESSEPPESWSRESPEPSPESSDPPDFPESGEDLAWPEKALPTVVL
jgi:hypothetical protein